jgi:hypothetical protein
VTTDIAAMMKNPGHEARVRTSRRQLADWVKAERPGVPVFALPGAPPAHRRRCLSCGARIKRSRWRCDACLAAVHEALEAAPPPPGDALPGDLSAGDRPVGGCGHARPCPWHGGAGSLHLTIGPRRMFDPRKRDERSPR